MWERLVISSLMQILLIAVKNEQKRAALRDRLREVRDAIEACYANDPAF